MGIAPVLELHGEHDGLLFKLCIFDEIAALVLHLQVFAWLIRRIIGRQLLEFHRSGFQCTTLAIRDGEMSSEGISSLAELSRGPNITCHVDAVEDAWNGTL